MKIDDLSKIFSFSACEAELKEKPNCFEKAEPNEYTAIIILPLQYGALMIYKNENLSLNDFELTIFEHSYSPIVVTTPQLEGEHPKIIYTNDAFTKMTGYSKEDILGKTPQRSLKKRRIF